MASLNSTIKIESDLRPCICDGVPFLFHRWVDVQDTTFALCENNDGVIRILPMDGLRFTDNKFKEYSF